MPRSARAPTSPSSHTPLASRWRDDAAVRVGISTCLLGREVRWDGGHKHDRFLTQGLGPWVEWVPVCPELELGLGVPREPIRLARRDGAIRLVAEKSGSDHTAAMERYARRRVRDLEAMELCGYVLKRDSPSCGMERVKIWTEKGMPEKKGRGAFARVLMERCALLPIEEEGRLHDARLRENFVERIFAYRRLRSLFQGRWALRDLVAFHTAHKLQLLSHAPEAYRGLGRLVAEGKGMGRAELRDSYQEGFMQALARMATPRRHVNVLQHVMGHFRGLLDRASVGELHTLIEDYRRGLVPLVVPLTLVRHHVARLGVEYLAGQVYLEPHPKELMLRNHV